MWEKMIRMQKIDVKPKRKTKQKTELLNESVTQPGTDNPPLKMVSSISTWVPCPFSWEIDLWLLSFDTV